MGFVSQLGILTQVLQVHGAEVRVSGNNGFLSCLQVTSLFQQLSQTADTAEETVEEFFNEETEDLTAPEKAE